MDTTTITATATVRVRGLNSPEAASAVAGLIGDALASSMRAARNGNAGTIAESDSRPRNGRRTN